MLRRFFLGVALLAAVVVAGLAPLPTAARPLQPDAPGYRATIQLVATARPSVAGRLLYNGKPVQGGRLWARWFATGTTEWAVTNASGYARVFAPYPLAASKRRVTVWFTNRAGTVVISPRTYSFTSPHTYAVP